MYISTALLLNGKGTAAAVSFNRIITRVQETIKLEKIFLIIKNMFAKCLLKIILQKKNPLF